MDDGRKPPDRPQMRRTCDRSRRLVADAEKVLDYSRRLIEESQRLIKESRCRSARIHPAGDYASGVGVGSGSDCVATARERGRLGLDLVGADAASLWTSGLDLERLVRLGLGVV